MSVSVCVPAGMLRVTRQGRHLCQFVCASWHVACVVCDKTGMLPVSVNACVSASTLCVLCVT